MSSFGIPVRNGLGVGLLASTSLSTRNSSAFTPASLFAAGEGGFWLDPSDFSTMFQDSAGTTPVTATGQTVGLILDKSKGLVLGPELVTNGDFSSGFGTGWTDASSGTGSASISGGQASVTSNTSANPGYVVQSITTVVGRSYLLTWQVVSGASAQVRVGTSSTGTQNAQITLASIVSSAVFVATATTTFVTLANNNSITTSTYDNISVKELPGNHFLQATAAKRPILGTEPSTGRRNLLLQTGLTGATSGTPGTAPTGWTLLVGGGTTTVIPGGGSLGGDAIRLSAVASRHLYNQSSLSLAASSVYTFSVQCFVHTATNLVGLVAMNALPAGSTVDYLLDGVVVPNITVAPLGPCTVGMRITTSATAGFSNVRIGAGAGGVVTADVTFSDPQFELGTTATDYQRVTDQWNVTEAGVTPCYYLQGDGTDDVLNSVAAVPANASTSAQQIFGVRTGATLTGAIAFATRSTIASGSSVPSFAPGSMGLRLVNFASSPTMVMSGVDRVQLNLTGVTADTKYVYSLLGDISAPSMVARRNATPDASNTTSLSGGTFTDTTAYIIGDATTAFFPGRVYQAVMRFGPNLTADQITQTETFVNDKTGAY